MPASAIILVLLSTFLHAGWNLLVGAQQRTSYMLLRIILVIALVGLGPALAAEFFGSPFPAAIWPYLLATGLFQSVYHFGLAQGYRNGHFTVVYPVARALPILLVAFIDILRGHPPSAIAVVGMVLVLVGCTVTPLESLRTIRLAYYWNRTMVWIVVTALGTVGYTAVDNAAAELVGSGPTTAARYGIYEFAITALFYWLILKAARHPLNGPGGWQGWKLPAMGAVGFFGAYWLILWSYQLSAQASYVVALRQFSIVIGVVVGAILFKEPAPGLRISASLAIVAGIALIALAG